MTDLLLSKPLQLPCGLTLPNRLVKAALAEEMADRQNLPTTAQMHRAYGAWADGGWGMILTGNVQVDDTYLGGFGDCAMSKSLPEEKILEAYKAYAGICRRNGTPTIMQINHPGRQSPLGAGKKSYMAKNIAPSAVQLDMGDDIISKIITTVVFGTPKEMSVAEIEDVVQRFANTARIAAEAGFDGVEIHAAHGYLLSQFLSEKSNKRTDKYGGTPAARAKIIVDIAKAIRAATPASFCVGLKFNSADHQSPKELQECLEQISLIAEVGLDFLEVSGGSYENPTMFTGTGEKKSASTAARESFFLEFAREMRAKLPNVPLMVTGGFRTRAGMEEALAEGACDLIGLGRPSIINPSLPANTILNKEVKTDDATLYARRINTPWILKRFGPKSVGSGVEITWYRKQMQAIGR
ncbi:related to NADH oxidase [Fusarium torulosum]|uniref:Related to NADH oxidase n=1 Tax=Fusarium torulosum TaxID=33205 RepID=A0AAE8M5D3_9HYPO|nr:related to NADH oxidase [Fusarium torulosum]